MKPKISHHKIFVVLLSFVILTSTVTYPHRAHAFLGVGDVVAVDLEQAARSNIVDPLAYTVAKIALGSLTKSVVNWINSGFSGSPAFVQDLNATLLTAGDTEASRFIDEFTKSGALQNLPWRDEVAQAVLSGYLRSTSRDSFSLENPDTLSQVSSDPEGFARGGDFTKGGLDAWMSLVLNPANSPRGLFEASRDTLNSRVASVKGEKVAEINRNNGFLSFRGKCPSASPFLGGSSNPNTNVLSLTGGASSGSGGLTLANSQFNKPTTVLNNIDTCAGQPILTPGSIIAQAANKHLVDSGVEQFISADSVGEIVSALVGQLVGTVLGGGGLAGVSKPSSGGGRSYIDTAGDPATQVAASASFDLSNSFLQTIGQQAGLIKQYGASWTTIGTAASQARTALGGAGCPLVDSTISQAGISAGVAANAVGELNKIISQFTLAVGQDPTNQQTSISDATIAYEQLQANGSLPSSAELTYGISEGVDRPEDKKNNVTASLLTKMNQIATSKTCQ